MKRKKFSTAFWVKAMLWLLLIMFIFTVVGRAAASFTVAQVKAESPSARKLLYNVEAQGRIGKNREIAVLCQPDILIQSILVSEGQGVEKGEVLAKLDAENVKEQIESLGKKKRSYMLQNQEYQKNQDADADSRIYMNRILIGEIEKEIEKLQKVQKQKYCITAPRDGVITSVLVSVGQRTPDSAVFTMTDDSAGLKFTGQVALEDAKYISAGDSIILKNENRKLEDIKITTLDMDEGREFMNVTAIIPAKTFSLGETVSMVVEQESKNYSCTVPVTAVHQENSKYYVLLLEKRNTVLGQQKEAVRMEVTVLERNGQFAALEEGVLSDDSQIITDTDRYVAAGDRVRLRGE